MSLYTLVYHSKAVIDFNRYALQALLLTARQHNARHDITGMLLYADGHFIQVLEGEKPVIDELYQHIQNDSRHIKVRKIYEHDIEERAFAEWSMGFKELTRQEYRNISNLSLFLSEQNQELELTATDIYQLLTRFRQDPACFS